MRFQPSHLSLHPSAGIEAHACISAGDDWHRFPVKDDVPGGPDGAAAAVGHGGAGALPLAHPLLHQRLHRRRRRLRYHKLKLLSSGDISICLLYFSIEMIEKFLQGLGLLKWLCQSAHANLRFSISVQSFNLAAAGKCKPELNANRAGFRAYYVDCRRP